ncbi:hypothetical protein D1007_11631 [Hordeum vulgare]|nr:hypothetical protein D1007_11631 [Hordeum vulgare]
MGFTCPSDAPPPRVGAICGGKPPGLEKVQLVVAANSNEWGATKIRLGSWPRGEKASAVIRLHFHALLSGVLPSFSGFLEVVLSHYQIHALHLDPCSLILLSTFAFLWEAFIGVTPSMSLLHHFFSLELASKMQCCGCAFLKIDDVSAPGVPSVEILPEAEGFRWQLVLVEAAGAGALFQPPPSPATPKQGWECEELSDPRLARVLTRLGELRHAGVSMAMVMRKFICWQIVPLQRHSRPMWDYTRPGDSVRTQVTLFSSDVLHELLRRLTGGNPDELPRDSQPLDHLKALKDLTMEMPLFDEWGFSLRGKNIPKGLCLLGSGPVSTLSVWFPPESWWATHRRLLHQPDSMPGRGWW